MFVPNDDMLRKTCFLLFFTSFEWSGPAPPGGVKGNSAQQAISSRVPRVVCRGTLTVWLIDSEWFTTGSHVL